MSFGLIGPHSASTTPAVIIGADACGLGLVRSLGAAGVPVIIADADPRRPAMHSRYARPYVLSGTSGPGLVEGLLKLRASLEERPLLFATTDPQVRTVSEHREILSKSFLIRLPPLQCVRELLSKWGFQRIAEEHGFPVPHALRIRSEEDFASIGRIEFPAVIKSTDKELVLRGVAPRAERVQSRAEAEAVCRAALPAAHELILQEWIEGAESDIYFCLQYRGGNGVTVSSFTGRKLRCWPPETGNTASCTAAPEMQNVLEPLTTAFFDQTGVEGMCSMEFKLDRRRGSFLMVEPTIGRVDWQEEAAAIHGINIPLSAYFYELGLPPPAIQKVSPPPRVWSYPPTVWLSIAKTKSFGRRRPAGARLFNPCWQAGDPVPFAYFFLGWIQKAWKRLW
jgi:predicted ATP-grasp superfamily ATP-dependent carboligase